MIDDLRAAAKLLAWREVYTQVLNVPGAIVEMGVGAGHNLACIALLRRLLEPQSDRAVIGFDTFGGGIPSVHVRDRVSDDLNYTGDVVGAVDYGDTRPVLREIFASVDVDATIEGRDTKLLELVKGDILETLPDFLERRQHLVVSVLSLDLDVYEPTRLALDLLLPRMPVGAIVVLDELNHQRWPGETLAAYEVGLLAMQIKKVPWLRDWAYVVL